VKSEATRRSDAGQSKRISSGSPTTVELMAMRAFIGAIVAQAPIA
jgi:hypothetical protein